MCRLPQQPLCVSADAGPVPAGAQRGAGGSAARQHLRQGEAALRQREAAEREAAERAAADGWAGRQTGVQGGYLWYRWVGGASDGGTGWVGGASGGGTGRIHVAQDGHVVHDGRWSWQERRGS